MKTVLPLLLLLFSLQSLGADPDSLWTASHLKSLSSEERQSSVKAWLKTLNGEEKKARLEGLIQISGANDWKGLQGYAERNLGLFYYSTAGYAEALDHYQKALLLFEDENDLANQGEIYNLLATLSKKQKDYERAISYLDSALKLCTQVKDSACISTVYDNRGLIYAEQKAFKKAKASYLITLDLRERLKDTVGLGYVYSNLAEIASHDGAFELAEQYLMKSNDYKLLSADRFGESVNYTNLGELYFKQKKFRPAARYFERSLALSNDMGIADLSQWNYRFLSRCYSALGETEQALDYLTQSHQLKDSLLSAEKISQITEMETRFDTERKEQQIKLQHLEIENQRQRNRNQLFVAIGLLSLLTLGFITLFINYKSRQQSKLQTAQIAFQQELLKTTIQTQEEERLRISKDLHDGIGQQLSGLKMAWQQLGGSIQTQVPGQSAKINELSQVLGQAADEVRAISHQMMPKALQEYGLLAASEDLLDTTFKNISIQYDFEHHGMEGLLAKDIRLSAYRILQELINNITKHAEASEVSIQMMKNKKHLIMLVEDNGKGLPENTEGSKGQGMNNMYSRAQLVGGNLTFEPVDPGTLATLRIPLVPQGNS